MADVFQVNGNDSSCMVCACAMWPVWTDLECATSTVMPCVNRCLVHECAVEQSMGGLSMFSSEFGVLQDHRLELSGCCGRPQGVNRQPACTSGNGGGKGIQCVLVGWLPITMRDFSPLGNSFSVAGVGWGARGPSMAIEVAGASPSRLLVMCTSCVRRMGWCSVKPDLIPVSGRPLGHQLDGPSSRKHTQTVTRHAHGVFYFMCCSAHNRDYL